jgi:hypothetical protein
MVCHGEHTYLYSQVLMHILAQESKGGSNIRRLCQELQKSAQARSEKLQQLIVFWMSIGICPAEFIIQSTAQIQTVCVLALVHNPINSTDAYYLCTCPSS